jgi:hypothetical protein
MNLQVDPDAVGETEGRFDFSAPSPPTFVSYSLDGMATPRWAVADLGIETATEESASGVIQLADVYESSDFDGSLAGDYETSVLITPSDLEDLLDLEGARSRIEGATEDDWVSWDEIEAGLRL